MSRRFYQYERRPPLPPLQDVMRPVDVWRILIAVDDGLMTVREAAEQLRWNLDDLQEILWGEVRL